ncbi:MAG: phosphoribosyl 1,2-cyclic phosphate phosphodiesterase [Sphingobacteriales bacterium]
MKITFLGTGTSTGVPVIACNCEVCTSSDSKDKRTRSSVLVEVDGQTIVIDTGPDFRQQMLNAKVQKLDAVFYTHEHKDHTAGLDDIRAFNFVQKRAIDVFADVRVQKQLKMEFSYIFSDKKLPGLPEINLHSIENTLFDVNGIEVLPIEVLHHKLPVLGFRIKDFTYITDAKTIAEEELEKIKGSKVLVLNALRKTDHISHLSLSQALEIIDYVKPEKAYLTHISHFMGTHEETNKLLPNGVEVAFDGLIIE